uniref:asparaginase n=1 Tax=Panagrellus redivivus TaxID=6233 RepID=A0A7E4V4X9_PANRE
MLSAQGRRIIAFPPSANVISCFKHPNSTRSFSKTTNFPMPLSSLFHFGNNERNSSSNRFCYYTWHADGTERLNEMDIARTKLDKLKLAPSTGAISMASEASSCNLHDDSPSPELLDESSVGQKNLIFAPDNNRIVKKHSISHFVHAAHHQHHKKSVPGVKPTFTTDGIGGGGGREMPEAKVLVLYTGGTVGMRCNKDTGVYEPEPHYLPLAIREIPPLNDKEYIEQHFSDVKVQPYCLPPVRHMKKRVIYWVVEYEPLLDSSDMTFDDWIRIAKDIRKSYHNYDGFVVLHGTDTLAYTASALSFMMENLGKPVVITGAQIPVAEVRSDGRENLIGALIVAGNFDIPEVSVYFNNKLLRGNRTTKLDNCGLEAFDSPNMNPLASMEITIKICYESIFRSGQISHFRIQENLCRNVSILRIFPSISIDCVRAALQDSVEGVVLQTYGSGNMPSRRLDIIEEIEKAVKRGCIVVNCSQCIKGMVDGNYFTGKILYDVGVIPGSDMTTESALVKLSYVLGHDDWDLETKKRMMGKNLRGEMTIAHSLNDNAHDIVASLARNIGINTSHEVELLRQAVFPPLVCHYARLNDVAQLRNLRLGGANMAAPDCNNTTALHIAAEMGHLETVQYLLKWGASVHARDGKNENPLVKAVHSKNLEVIKLLRETGGVLVMPAAEIGIMICVAASKGDDELLLAMHAAGATFAETDYNGRTALHAAVVSGLLPTIRLLCDRGASPNQSDNFGNTPLAEARAVNREDIVEILESYLPKTGPTNGVRAHSLDDDENRTPKTKFSIGGEV